jgi:flavin-dependent dehydrogenase
MNDGQLFDTIIIGAGAAGLYCAGLLGQKGYRVLLIELNKQVGRKILYLVVEEAILPTRRVMWMISTAKIPIFLNLHFPVIVPHTSSL